MASPEEMRREQQDQLAREAARELFQQPGLALAAALARARSTLGADTLPRPARSLVMRHLEAMMQRAHGTAGLEELRRQRLESILELLDLVETIAAPEAIVIAGRLAEGYMDGPLEVHARLYGCKPLESIAGVLEETGVEDLAFKTADTRLGRLSRLVLRSDGIDYIMTRCPMTMHKDADRNLFSGERIAVVDLEGLRSRLEQGFSQDRP